MRPFHRGRGRGNPRGGAVGQGRGFRSRPFKPKGRISRRGNVSRVYRLGNERSEEVNRGQWDDFTGTNYKSGGDHQRYGKNDYYSGTQQRHNYSVSSYGKHHKYQRSRHESDSFEHRERDRYNRDDLDREYDKYYGNDDDSYDEAYINEEWEEYEREKSYEERDHQGQENRQYQDEWAENHSNHHKRRPYENNARRNSYEHKYKERGDPEHNEYRDKRDYYGKRELRWDRNYEKYKDHESSGKWNDNERYSEPKESNTDKVDWETNESGIKMAIEYLKSKPTYEKENADKEKSEDNGFPEITPDSLEKEALEDLVSDLLNLILKNGGEISIPNLGKQFTSTVKHRFKNKTLKSFLSKFPTVFELDQTYKTLSKGEGETQEENSIVCAKTEVKLCEVHCTRPKTCPGDCNAFHICKFYILSSCEISKCKFGHNLTDDHNIEVQQKFYLHRVELQNLCLLLQHDSNRSSITVPAICRYYNSMGGCRSDENVSNDQKPQFKCPFVHLCQKYVEGHCSVWSSCRRSHNLTQGSAYRILSKYGLDPRCLVDGQNRVLSLLQWSLNDFRGKLDSKSIAFKQKDDKTNTEQAEDTKQRLKRKVQVADGDEISVKIQKIIENKENHPNTLLEDKKAASLAAEELLAATSSTDLISAVNGNPHILNRETTHHTDRDKPENEGDLQCLIPSWSIEEKKICKELSCASSTELETKYQEYLAARIQTVLLDGKYFKVDFGKLEGSYSGSLAVVKVQRSLIQTQHGITETEN